MFYCLKQHLSTWWQRFFFCKGVKLVLEYESEQDNNIFHMQMAQFHLPPNLDLTDGNLADSFRKWKRQLEVYMEASGANNKPKQRQTAIILHCAGPQVLEVYDHFHFEADDDKTDPAKILEKLEEYCNQQQNEVL